MFALRVLPALVCVLLYAPATAAQTPPRHDRMEPTAVTLTTDSGRVRFTSPGAALDWRLEVVNAHNDIIFDTGVVNGTELEWPLVDAQGQPIESGTYRYTLTIQADQATLRVQRGEWQIERLNSVYQMSALSADSTGGVILSATDAVPQPATAAPMGALSQSFRRSLGTVTFIQPLISGSGTTNAMTKWTDGPSGVVGDSNVAEANGSVVIGNGSFYGNLHVFGAAGSDVYAGMGPNLITGPGFNYGYAGGTFGRSAGFFNVRPDASALPPNPSLRFMTGNVERVIITNTGNVGIGTSFPTAKLHAFAGSGNAVYGVSSTSVGISGFSSSGSGVVGLSISGNGVVGASTMGTAGYFDGNVEVTGGVGVGVSGSTAARVYAVASGFATAVHGVSTSGSAVIGASHSGTGVTGMSSLGDAGFFLGNVTVTGNLTVNGTCFCTLSDARLKQDVELLPYGLRQVLQLRPVTWHWRNRPTAPRDLGLIAQDVEPLLPELVQRAADDPDGLLRLNYVGLLPVLIKAIQEQQAALEQKDAEIRRLHARDRDQETRLTALEARLQQLLTDLGKRPTR